LRLHSQLTRKAIEALRFASGDEDIRSPLYDKLGEALFEDFDSVRTQLDKFLANGAILKVRMWLRKAR